eukprot:6182219-Pleurochrysis_carterae.AAC.4
MARRAAGCASAASRTARRVGVSSGAIARHAPDASRRKIVRNVASFDTYLSMSRPYIIKSWRNQLEDTTLYGYERYISLIDHSQLNNYPRTVSDATPRAVGVSSHRIGSRPACSVEG